MRNHAHRVGDEDELTWRELIGSLVIMVLLVVDLYAAILIFGAGS